MACTSSAAYMLLSAGKPLSPEVHKLIEMININKAHKFQAQIREMLRGDSTTATATAKSKKKRSKKQFPFLLLPTIYEEADADAE